MNKVTVITTLTIEAARASEMSINSYQTTPRNNPDDSCLQQRTESGDSPSSSKCIFLPLHFVYVCWANLLFFQTFHLRLPALSYLSDTINALCCARAEGLCSLCSCRPAAGQPRHLAVVALPFWLETAALFSCEPTV
jgi:hypothetical protein